MNVVLLYLLLLKGTATAFAGLASLPVIHDALVTQFHVLTNEQLNEAVVITRSTPGPIGPLYRQRWLFRCRHPWRNCGLAGDDNPSAADHPACPFRWAAHRAPKSKRGAASGCDRERGPIAGSLNSFGTAALTDWVTIAIAAVSLALLLTTELDTLWIILGAAPSRCRPLRLG